MSYFDEHNVEVEDGANEQEIQLSEEEFRILAEEYLGALRTGAKPPASKTALRELKVVYYDSKRHKDVECPICAEDYKKDDALYKLPCKHLMHKKCLEVWYEKNNSCPLCRHELITDDPDYNVEKMSKDQSRDTHSFMYM